MIENDKNIEVAYRTPLDDSFWKWFVKPFVLTCIVGSSEFSFNN